MAIDYWARIKVFVILTTEKIYRIDLICFLLILLCVSQKEMHPSIRTRKNSVGSHVSSLIFKDKDSDKIKSALCLLCCHKPFFEATTVSNICYHVWVASGDRHIIGLKPKYFSNCYFPLLLGFLYPLTLEAEVLRYCCEWHCLTIYGKTLQEGAYASKTKHQPSPSAKIRVVSSTCQAIRAKKTRGSCGFRGQQMFHGF